MGFDEGRLEFDHPNLVYYPGEILMGKLVFDQTKDKKFRGIYAKVKGYCDVQWRTRHHRRVNDRDETYYIEHTSHETYFEQKVYLIGSESGETKISPGHYEYPFQCMIPHNCPSSFEASDGQIRYEVKVVVDRSFKFDQEKKLTFTVINRKDLNMNPYCKEPMDFAFDETYCCWCMSSGSCEVTVRLPQSGYCPGQTIRAEVGCSNQSNVEIEGIKFEVIERRKFIANHNPDTRKDKNVIVKRRKGPIPGNTTRNWVVEIDIPEMDVYNVDACSFIEINYEFEVTISPSGCHSDTDQSKPFIIGHIPLREFEESGPPMDKIVTQPVAPNMSQYPGQFPSGPSYPVTHQPQPSPYPGNSPYPANGTSPYPNNSPYPGVSPYPANPPYPGGAMPTVSPYPAANPPYPGGNMPGVSPYPVGTDPYVPKPTEPGFKIPHDANPSFQPLATNHTPYPANGPVGSPYAQASAPEPSTPDA